MSSFASRGRWITKPVSLVIRGRFITKPVGVACTGEISDLTIGDLFQEVLFRRSVRNQKLRPEIFLIIRIASIVLLENSESTYLMRCHVTHPFEQSR